MVWDRSQKIFTNKPTSPKTDDTQKGDRKNCRPFFFSYYFRSRYFPTRGFDYAVKDYFTAVRVYLIACVDKRTRQSRGSCLLYEIMRFLGTKGRGWVAQRHYTLYAEKKTSAAMPIIQYCRRMPFRSDSLCSCPNRIIHVRPYYYYR